MFLNGKTEERTYFALHILLENGLMQKRLQSQGYTLTTVTGGSIETKLFVLFQIDFGHWGTRQIAFLTWHSRRIRCLVVFLNYFLCFRTCFFILILYLDLLKLVRLDIK